MKIPLTEHQIQDLLIEYLQRKKYYVQRMNSGRTRIDYTKKVKYGKQEFEVPTQRNIVFGQVGTPDIMAFKVGDCDPAELGRDKDHAELLFVEVKRPGNKPTALQKAKMQELEMYGARCIVATSLEDLQAEGI